MIETGKKILNHRYTGYLLDAAFMLALLAGILYTQAGINTLEQEGCSAYYVQHVPSVSAVDVQSGTFIREGEKLGRNSGLNLDLRKFKNKSRR